MDWAEILEPTVAPQFLASLLMLALAAWLLGANFDSRMNRAFALFLILRATTLGIATAANVLDPPEPPIPYLWRVNAYFLLAMFPALVYFVAVYPVPRRWIARGRPGGWLLLGAAVALEAWYLLQPCAYYCYAPGSELMTLGPLAVLISLFYFAIALVGLVLAFEYVRAKRGPKRDGLFLVAAIFILNSLVDGTKELTELVRGLADPSSGTYAFVDGAGAAALGYAPNAWATPAFVAGHVTVIPAVVALGLVFTHWARKPDGSPRRRRTFAVAAVVAVLSGLLIGYLRDTGGAGVYFFQGFWRVSIPLVCSYAILRYQLFDIDLRLKSTVKRGTVGAAFLLVFFLASEGAEALVSDQVGTIAGFVAAATLALSLRPLERAASRLTEAMMPTVRPSTDHMALRKAEVYRTALESVLVDGRVTQDERAVLARLRSKLGLDAEAAGRIEREVGYA